jgi:hypothetical protein
MQIDRSNYEIWLIDWLDGNLSELQVEQVQAFLKENPDIKEDFDDMDRVRDAMHCVSNETFPYKDHLKKKASEISESQFDYLCVAFLENDLSADQQTGLKESMEQDREKKKSFELIQKMKISPADIRYKHKNKLIRRTVAQNVIRLSFIGLTAAAIITYAIITFHFVPRSLQVKNNNTAQSIAVDSTIQKPAAEIISGRRTTEKKDIPYKKQTKNLFSMSQKKSSVITETEKNLALQNDSTVRSAYNPLPVPDKIPVSAKIDFKNGTINNNLIALKVSINIPVYDDGRSKLSKFIAKTFREKILKEKTTKDNPLKAYEIAEAGVAGLNKLLGWEMALSEKNDENGKLKSIYFSSRLLKFNAPVKKSEPLQ